MSDNFYKKILKREDGSQVLIEIHISADFFRNTELKYGYDISIRSKGKRKWLHIPSQGNGRLNKEVLKVVSADEILEAETEFWNTLKPIQHCEFTEPGY